MELDGTLLLAVMHPIEGTVAMCNHAGIQQHDAGVFGALTETHRVGVLSQLLMKTPIDLAEYQSVSIGIPVA